MNKAPPVRRLLRAATRRLDNETRAEVATMTTRSYQSELETRDARRSQSELETRRTRASQSELETDLVT